MADQRLSWHGYFLAIAELAAQRSRDPSLKVGAVLVSPDRVILSTGYNGLPRGVEPRPERLERPEKYEWTVHAEANAILNASRVGARLTGATLYASQSPCHRCAVAIIQAGVARVVYPVAAAAWKIYGGEESRTRAAAMLTEASVRLTALPDAHRYEELT